MNRSKRYDCLPERGDFRPDCWTLLVVLSSFECPRYGFGNRQRVPEPMQNLV
jgi:hypothetical protein